MSRSHWPLFGLGSGAGGQAEGAARRIDKLNDEIRRSESSQREARDALRDSERAISNANRALERLGAEARTVRAEAAGIAKQRESLQIQVTTREAAIERMLAAWAAAGTPDALRVVLSGNDPADIGRALHYLGHISRAAAELLAEQRAAVAELERLAGDAKARAERLRDIEQASRADRDKLLKERHARAQLLSSLSSELRKNRKEIRVLRADEARLARIVEALGRSPPRPREPFPACAASLACRCAGN